MADWPLESFALAVNNRSVIVGRTAESETPDDPSRAAIWTPVPSYPFRKPELAESTTAVIQAVTQQFSRRFDYVAHGWKTVTLIDFPRGCTQSIARLPAVDAWTFALEASVCLADRATVDALLSAGLPSR